MKELNRFRKFLTEEQTNEGFFDSIFAPEKKIWRQKLQQQADQGEEEDPMDHFDFLPPGQLDGGYAEMIHMISSEDGIRNHPKIDAFIKSIARGEQGIGSRQIRAKYQELKNQLNEELNEEEINEAALSNQEIVAKVEEFINGPLNQLRKEVYNWYNSFDPNGPESDDEKAFYLREALSDANKGIKQALTGVKKLK